MRIELTQEQERIIRENAQRKGITPDEEARLLVDRAFGKEDATEEPDAQNGAELIAQWEKEGVLGAWADREDIADSAEYARKLRQEAERRDRD